MINKIWATTKQQDYLLLCKVEGEECCQGPGEGPPPHVHVCVRVRKTLWRWQNWQWGPVLFTDEGRLTLCTCDRCERTWRWWEEHSAVCNVLRRERDTCTSHTKSVSGLQSGQEVQQLYLNAARVDFLHSAVLFLHPDVWKWRAGTMNGELDTVNMCRHIAKLVAF